MMVKSTASKVRKADNQASDRIEARVPRAAFTIKEFCEAHRLSEAMYFKLCKVGLGPRVMRAGRRVTISMEAAIDWRRARENAA